VLSDRVYLIVRSVSEYLQVIPLVDAIRFNIESLYYLRQVYVRVQSAFADYLFIERSVKVVLFLSGSKQSYIEYAAYLLLAYFGKIPEKLPITHSPFLWSFIAGRSSIVLYLL
jgi:hypothetical protein